jgi:hypothetical protein
MDAKETRMMTRSFAELERFAEVARVYRVVRDQGVPASAAYSATKDSLENGVRLEEAVCSFTGGHSWHYSGTAYGGDDERYHGEGTVRCSYCGADGDA